MVEYNIVKYCRLCKKRFIVSRGESKINYCKECQAKIDKQNSGD